MRLVFTILLLFTLTACLGNTELANNVDNEGKEAVTEQELIQLFNEKNYDEITKLTAKQDTQLEKSFFNLAVAYKEIEKEKEDDFKYYSYSSYKYIEDKLNNVIDPPLEISKRIEVDKKMLEQKCVDYVLQNSFEIIDDPQPVYIGMTRLEVLKEGWGKPKDINRTTTSHGTREQWIYDNYQYLYFEDGVLTTIQN